MARKTTTKVGEATTLRCVKGYEFSKVHRNVGDRSRGRFTNAPCTTYTEQVIVRALHYP